jgi:hypothetical protein
VIKLPITGISKIKLFILDKYFEMLYAMAPL